MKKIISLLLASLLVLSLFAGCGGTAPASPGGAESASPGGSGTAAPTSQAAAPGKTEAPSGGGSAAAPAEEEDSPYHLAAGKFQKDENGRPLEKYVYDRPLCDNDVVLTKWSSCFTPQYIPEDGWGEIPTWKQLREYTGVHVEYSIVASANRSQNFSVLLASDSLDDIIDGAASFYKAGTLKTAVEDGYYVNLADYQDYMPNFLWELYNRAKLQADMIPKVFYDDETIPVFYGMVTTPVPSVGIFLRQDWMDEMGMGKAYDVKTYDQFTEVVRAMKVNYSKTEEIYPYYLTSLIDKLQGLMYSGYDTTIAPSSLNAYPRVKDGKVEFCGTTEDCHAAMTQLNSWFNDGLISPNYRSFETGDSSNEDTGLYQDKIGVYSMVPTLWSSLESNNENPNTDWEPMPRLKKTESQVLKYGYAKARDSFGYSSCAISGRCEAIELAVSWVDWFYSDFGSEYSTFGAEGYLWNYNEAGERRLTDWCLNHEAGVAWIMCIYGIAALIEVSLYDNMRDLYYDGGDRIRAAYDVLTVQNYKGEYDWPGAITFTDDERSETTTLFADLNTYFAENFSAFVDNSKPMSEWDSYVDGLYTFGYERVQEIYQAAYGRYQERMAQ